MPRVFVVNEPLKLDEATGNWVRYLNLRRATDHGELVYLLPGGPLADDPRPSIAALTAGLADFTSEDFLLLVGDPRAIAWAAAIAADRTGGPLRLLQWKREQKRYDPVVVDVFPESYEALAPVEDV